MRSKRSAGVSVRLSVSYNPRSYYERLPELRECIDMIASGYFSPEDPNLFRSIVSTLLDHDRYRQTDKQTDRQTNPLTLCLS